MLDIVIAVQAKYVTPNTSNGYEKNIHDEDQLLIKAAENLGLTVKLVAWDDAAFDWSSTKAVLIREIWDYFKRFDEFKTWLAIVQTKTRLINSAQIIEWNQDKHYLADLEKKGIAIVPTMYIEQGSTITLAQAIAKSPWENCILKPCVSGAARHTYKVNGSNSNHLESSLAELLVNESMMLQPFVKSIASKGELSFIVLDGKYSHAVLKKAKTGDFRVQDDWGGTLHDYSPTPEEKKYAEHVVTTACPEALYARVDVAWGDDNEFLIVELELIEPELWFRRHPEGASILMKGIKRLLN